MRCARDGGARKTRIGGPSPSGWPAAAAGARGMSPDPSGRSPASEAATWSAQDPKKALWPWRVSSADNEVSDAGGAAAPGARGAADAGRPVPDAEELEGKPVGPPSSPGRGAPGSRAGNVRRPLTAPHRENIPAP